LRFHAEFYANVYCNMVVQTSGSVISVVALQADPGGGALKNMGKTGEYSLSATTGELSKVEPREEKLQGVVVALVG
jgi:hypothetical protein